MNDSLTARQTQILKILVDEYIDSASPVGSEILERKYNLGVSSATVRSEMVELTKKGYLKQPHTSAGRIPTSKAMKFYVGQLMEERSMSLSDEVKVKTEVMKVKNDTEALMEELTESLSNVTNSLAVSAIEGGKSWHYGLSHVLENPEFCDFGICGDLLSFLESGQELDDLFFHRLVWENPVEVMFGEELGFPALRPMGLTATSFNLGGKKAALAVVGPMRIRYQVVVPVVRHISQLMNSLGY